MTMYQDATNSISNRTRWMFADPPAPQAVTDLSNELRIPPTIASVLLQRGISDYEEARKFFRPSIEQLHDPYLMCDMENAVQRLLQSVRQRERICVYGDYDVDGTNGTAMLYRFLTELGCEADYFIPNRFKEGYGLSVAGIEKIRSGGYGLIIAVDCGITAVDAVQHASRHGIDVIICDHHEVGETLPPAAAVLDPLKPGDPYPFKGLCGCGVAFKFIQASLQETGRTELLPHYLDYVTLATIADIVPLTGENRILVRIGMQSLNEDPLPGIRALIEVSGLTPGTISAGRVVFALAPRINAAGRLGDAMRAVKLLVASNHAEGIALAGVLEEENRERRRIDEQTFIKAQELVDGSADSLQESAIVLHSDDWHPGVIGIVASRLVDKYYKPSVMLATVDGMAKGSARSVPGFDIYEALKQCTTTMTQFGGHKYAAGLTIDPQMVGAFAEKFKSIVAETLPDELRIPTLRVDGELSLADITPRFVRIMREFAPFGPGNSRPVFRVQGISVSGTPRIVGRNHLKFRAKQNGTVFDAIGFGLGDLLPLIRTNGALLDMVFSVDESDFLARSGRGNSDPVPQLKIRDIRVHEPSSTGGPTRTHDSAYEGGN